MKKARITIQHLFSEGQVDTEMRVEGANTARDQLIVAVETSKAFFRFLGLDPEILDTELDKMTEKLNGDNNPDAKDNR